MTGEAKYSLTAPKVLHWSAVKNNSVVLPKKTLSLGGPHRDLRLDNVAISTAALLAPQLTGAAAPALPPAAEPLSDENTGNVQMVLDYLQRARDNLRKTVAERLQKADKEMQEVEKAAAKKRIERKAEEIKARIAKIEERLGQIDPKALIIIKDMAKQLVDASGDLAQFEKMVSQIETELDASEIKVRRQRALLEFVLLLGHDPSEPISGLDQQAFKELEKAASQPGGLTRGKLNEILKKYNYGVEFCRVSFAYNWTGSKEKESVSGVRQLYAALDDFLVTAQYKLGERIDLDRLKKRTPNDRSYRDQIRKAVNGVFRHYASSDDFFFVDSGANWEMVKAALRQAFVPAGQKGPGSLSGDREFWQWLLSAKMSPSLNSVIHRIWNNGRSLREKMDELVMELLIRLREGINPDPGAPKGENEERVEREIEQAKIFEDLITKVQKPDADPKLKAAFVAEFARYISGEHQNFDYKAVLAGGK